VNWYENPTSLIFIIGLISQAAITGWRVFELDRRVSDLEICITESKEWRAANGQRLTDLVNDVTELRRKVWNGGPKP
jgi:hypothetical protein